MVCGMLLVVWVVVGLKELVVGNVGIVVDFVVFVVWVEVIVELFIGGCKMCIDLVRVWVELFDW